MYGGCLSNSCDLFEVFQHGKLYQFGYRDKDVVENSFDDLKSLLDIKRLRVQNYQTMEGRLFVQFLALILINSIRKKAQ